MLTAVIEKMMPPPVDLYATIISYPYMADSKMIGSDHAAWLAALDTYRTRLRDLRLKLSDTFRMPEPSVARGLDDLQVRLDACAAMLDKLEQRLHANIVDFGNEKNARGLADIPAEVLQNHVSLSHDFALQKAFIAELSADSEAFISNNRQAVHN